MHWGASSWRQVRRVFRLPATRRRLHDELDDELRFHLDGRVEDLMQREHLSRDAAEREARHRFGDYMAYRREARSIDDTMLQRRHRMELLDAVTRETRHAVRTLLRTPSFSLIVLVTLALGLGAATTIFTLLDRVVLSPLPYPTADRLVHLGTLWPKTKYGEEYALSKGQYFFFKQHSRVLADVAMYDADMAIIGGDAEHAAERVPLLLVSANIFSVLGIRPELGRPLTPDLELLREPRVALISYSYWQNRHGSDPGVIGKRIPLGYDGDVEIIGVLPPNAGPPDMKGDIWIRNYLNPSDRPMNNHTHHAIGLLAPGVSVESAAADIQRVQEQMNREYPDVYSTWFLNNAGFTTHVTSLRDSVVGGAIVQALWLLFAAVGFVLVIAGANVANLFLVRIETRRRESAVRAALGAGRSHLAIHYLSESLLLSLVAGLAAIALGVALLHTVLALAPQSLPRLEEVSFNWRSVAFCLGGAGVFGLAFGLLPIASAGVDVAVLRDGGRGMTTSRSRDLTRRGLVLSQVGLAVVLLTGALLMTKSFAKLRAVQPGFDPTGVLSMTVVLPTAQYLTYDQSAAFWRELTTRIEALPGVTHAGATDHLPLADNFGCSGLITDALGEKGLKADCMPMVSVTPGYFEAMGMKVRGTLPTWSAVAAGQGPLVVSAAFAKRFWGEEDPLRHGVKPFNPQMPSFTVVGVAEDMRGDGLQQPVVEAAYFSIIPPSPGMQKGMWGSRAMSVVVRAPNANMTNLGNAVRHIIRQMDDQVAITDIAPMELVMARSMAQTSFTMLLLLISALIALSLSAVGIYGVISYVVSQRRSEIGIRIALGANLAEVARLVVGGSMVLAGAGVIIGVVASLAATRLLGSLLFEVSPTDPLVLAGTALTLLLVAFVASLGPTRRAAKIDPVEAMRA